MLRKMNALIVIQYELLYNWDNDKVTFILKK
ncbi:Uncharacterised protein [Staphylococcus gallinarum]|uniref:Uncharacterized protein n=1 Tax=Staphylococcus gallinarum TaxID=1293 RepID=A0A380FH78_STAGA|nr:Uncharacterised protein [Staphylococcus gallinarum]